MLTDETASPTEARKNFFNLLERVANDHQIVVVQRRDGENVALIAESDLSSLMETAYLLKSPRNAQRLQAALERSKTRDGQPATSQSTEQAIAQLKVELGIGKEERFVSANPPQQPIQRVPIFDEAFRQDLGWWYKTNPAKVDKIFDLVSDVMRSPFEGMGKPEPLKYLEADTWSRRIDLEHRLIYRVRHERIDFLACRYHY